MKKTNPKSKSPGKSNSSYQPGPVSVASEPVRMTGFKSVEGPIEHSGLALVSTGGVVSAGRMKKAPTQELVQQLAKLLLQQTKET